MTSDLRKVASLEQIDEWERIGKACHDGEASWGQITTALEEAVDEVRFLRASLRDMLDLLSFTKDLPKRWGYEE